MTSTPQPRARNLVLRRARQSMRLSQAEFAQAVRAAGDAIGKPNRCTKRLVQKWENGEHTGCRPEYLTVLQAVTGLPARELGFQLPNDYAEPLGEVANLAEQLSKTPPPEPPAPGTAQYYTAAIVDTSMDRLGHALNHPSTVNQRTAHCVEISTARLFDLEHHSPAALLTRTVERHLSLVTALLTAAQFEKARRSLTTSSAATALLAGWLAFDRRDAASSHELWAAAISAAQVAANDDLFAATLTYQSYAADRRGDPAAAWQLAHTAAALTPQDPRAAAWATTRIALHAAQLGEHQDATTAMHRALETGQDLPNPKPGDHTQPWMRTFDRARLLATTAHTAALLADPNATYYATRAVGALGPAKVKSRAIVLAEAALATALAGELNLCLDYGGAAATLTRDLRTSLAADLLQKLIPTLLPHSETRPVRELLPHLAELTLTTDPHAEI